MIIHYTSQKVEKSTNILKDYFKKNNFILATVHRDSNTDNRRKLTSIFRSLLQISIDYKVVLPIHPRTKKLKK